MDWLEISISTSNYGIEIICGVLYNLGVTSLEIVDTNELKDLILKNEGQWDYIDESLLNLPEAQPIIKFYLSDDIYGHEQLKSVKATLNQLKNTNIGSLCLDIKNVNDEDWANNWKKYFKPFSVGKNLIIKPSWELLKPEMFDDFNSKIIINIDPGAAFGTGTHETTKLCLEMLEKHIKNSDMILDVGCGSGILSIAALLMGAAFVQGIDLDHIAVDTAAANLKINDISDDRYIVETANILEGFTSNIKFNIIVANIVADVIITLASDIKRYLDYNGIFICSGIIDSRISDVENALKENNFDIIENHLLKDWAVIVSRYQSFTA